MARAKVLVTGVAGFIGSHVAEHCVRAGCHVVGVDDLSGGFRRSVPAGVRFTVGAIRLRCAADHRAAGAVPLRRRPDIQSGCSREIPFDPRTPVPAVWVG